MSDVISLDVLGALMRRMQIDVRAINMKIDLLQRARERDVASAVTREDLRDIVAVLAEQLAEHIVETQRQIASSEAAAARRFDQTNGSLIEILARLPPA